MRCRGDEMYLQLFFDKLSERTKMYSFEDLIFSRAIIADGAPADLIQGELGKTMVSKPDPSQKSANVVVDSRSWK